MYPSRPVKRCATGLTMIVMAKQMRDVHSFLIVFRVRRSRVVVYVVRELNRVLMVNSENVAQLNRSLRSAHIEVIDLMMKTVMGESMKGVS